jgi:hypothetical protein
MLQQAASGNAESAADSLDVVFDVPELGQQLLRYASGGQVCNCHVFLLVHWVYVLGCREMLTTRWCSDQPKHIAVIPAANVLLELAL